MSVTIHLANEYQRTVLRRGLRTPLISVIIPTYNRASLIHETLESVFAQTFLDFEVIVVDDGSEDGTEDVVSSFEGVQYHKRPHLGNAAARNHGIARSRGTWLCFLDADDLWDPRKLELQLKHTFSSSDVRVSFPGGLRFRTDGYTEQMPAGPSSPTTTWSALVDYQPFGSSLSGVMIHRSCVEVLGGFDEGLKLSVDWDMWIRLATRFRLSCFPDPLVRVRLHSQRANSDGELRLRMYLQCLGKHRRLFCNVLGMRQQWRSSYSDKLMKLGRFYLKRRQRTDAMTCLCRSVRYDPRNQLATKCKLLLESAVRF